MRAHAHPFKGPLSRTTQVSRYQKGETNLHFTEARDSEWQWHQLGHMQVYTLLQTDNHASTLPLSFYRPDALLEQPECNIFNAGSSYLNVAQTTVRPLFRRMTNHSNIMIFLH